MYPANAFSPERIRKPDTLNPLTNISGEIGLKAIPHRLQTEFNGELYYDDQMIEVPKGKCMRQIGVYEYQTKSENWKTVPIVQLMNK